MWKVVIVDDDRHVLSSMKKLIPWSALNAVCVGLGMDGKHGIELITELKPHIVITDIYMPIMNGLEMIESIQNKGFTGKIIILSGYSDFEYARQALRLHVSDYLSKPVQLQTIQNVLGNVILQIEQETNRELEQQGLQKQLKIFEPIVKEQYVVSLLTGTLQQNHADRYARWSESVSNFQHVVIAIEMLRKERVSDVSIPDWHLFRFAVNNIISEVLEQEWPGSEFADFYSHHSALLLHFDKQWSAESVLQKTLEIGERMIKLCWDYLNIRLHLGVGGVKQQERDIHDSTEEAFLALYRKQRAAHSDMYVFQYEDEERTAEKDFFYPEHIPFFFQLAEAIKYARQSRVIDIIDEHLNTLASLNPAYPTGDLQQLGQEIWIIVANSFYETGVLLEELYVSNEIRSEIKEVSGIEAYRSWIHDKIISIYAKLSLNENIKHKQAVDFAIEYIHEHYAEDINLAELSEKVSLSRNHLSMIFKKKIGDTFNNYLTKVRMEKAKRLLLEGKYLIYEVAEMVGYKNVPYFSTLFKKYTNSNPSDILKQTGSGKSDSSE